MSGGWSQESETQLGLTHGGRHSRAGAITAASCGGHWQEAGTGSWELNLGTVTTVL